MPRPVILLALAVAAGIVMGEGFLYFPWSVIVLTLLPAFAVIVLARRNGMTAAGPLLTAAGMTAGMVLHLSTATLLPADHYVNIPRWDDAPRALTGRISSALDRDTGRTAFTLALESIDARKVSGALRVTIREEALPAGYGDRITCSGRLSPPRGSRNPGGFDYPAYLARHGVYAVLSLGRGGEVRVLEQGRGVLRAIQDWRERIRQSILRSLSGDGAALLLAMTIGEEGGLTDDLRDRFMAAGVTHIISISGSHLGMVAIICFWVTRNALFLLPERLYHRLTIHADPRKIAAGLTVLPVTFYAFLAGGQIATLRALIMILAGLTAVFLDREGDLLAALAVAALITLIPDTRALFDISFQLSYLSVLVIVFVASTWNSLALPAESRAAKLRNSALLLCLISVSAAVVTGPLVAFYFNQFSFAGILANMAVVPFAGAVVVPLGLISSILSLITGSLPLAAINQFAADTFLSLVSIFSRLPGAFVHLPSPGPLFLAGYAGLLGGTALMVRARLLARFRPLESPGRVSRTVLAAVTASVIVIIAATVIPLRRQEGARVTFVDVGQGDCALVETADGKTILVDGGGTRDNRFDIGRHVLSPYLWNRGIRTIDLVVLSHPHPDHMNGLLSVLKNFTVRAIWGSGRDTGLPGYETLQEIIRQRKIPFQEVTAGYRSSLGSAALHVLHPAPDFRQKGQKEYAAENDRSLVVRMELEGRALLFPGDVHAEGERDLLRNVPDLAADVVKVPHHGSRTSSTPELVAALRPHVAVITVGDRNPYRHPSDEVVARYVEGGAALSRTDRHGAVTVRVSRSGLDVQPWSELMLRRISPSVRNGWWAIERENWKRVAFRTAGI